jgi:hypothetical protein
MDVSGQIHATATLQPEKETKIPIKYEENWAQFWIIREKSLISVENRNKIMRLYNF